MRRLLLLLPFWGFTLLFAQTPSPFIHVDQFGYLPDRPKVAVISSPEVGFNRADSYTPGTFLQVWNATTNAIALSAEVEIWNEGAVHAQSGDRGWWVDFSELNTPGEYYLLDPSTGARSVRFQVSDTIYKPILRSVGRTFYLLRSNTDKPAAYAGDWVDGMNFMRAQQDGSCRYIYDQTNASLEKDLSGGWFHEAGYNKYVNSVHGPMHDLLSAYEENPDVFTDEWGIPESGNGLPDLIDEIKWELDWLLKMTNPDGSVHIKMGNRNYGENTQSPPSANSNGRYYGPTCSSASIVVASIMAHAVKVFAQFPSLSTYTDQLRQTATTCFNYSRTYVDNNSFETDCDDISVISWDMDQDPEIQLSAFLTAAIYLYEQTGDSLYHNYIINRAAEIEQFTNTYWGAYRMSVNDALVMYSRMDTIDPVISYRIYEGLGLNIFYGEFYGFSNRDLYRSHIPDWSYHSPSNQMKAIYGLLNQMVIRSGLAANLQTFERYMDESLHYLHGVNPMGLVYLSNMYDYGAERSVNQLYHHWFANNTIYDHALNSTIGPPPGFLVPGPNRYVSVETLTPPYGQPFQKSYLDYNDPWPQNSWEVSEPSINIQASYLRLLAHRTRLEETQTVGIQQAEVPRLYLYPNPTRQSLQLESPEPISSIEIWSMEGRQVLAQTGANRTVEVSGLSTGLYTIRVNGKYVERFRKE